MAKPTQRKHLGVEDASLADVSKALGEGKVTASALVRAYLARIDAYDRAHNSKGPRLNSVRELNPDALAIAGKLDGAKPSASQPLAGVPILVKDNIATGDRQPTTAGSLALEGARARDDATVVKLLREAGAVILGKANLTEFANILAIDMPSGYTSLGGQVKNPYAPALLDDRGIPGRAPGRLERGFGGRRGGRSVRGGDRHRDLGLAAEPRQPEWPRHRQADRRTDQPCRHPADLAQPGHRGPDDAHGARCGDAAERAGGQGPARSGDAAAAAAGRLHRRPRQDGLKGARIGVPSDPADPLNDPYYGTLPKWAKVMAERSRCWRICGAVIVRASMPTAGWIGGPGTTMAVLNRNPLSRNKGNPATPPIVFLYELKRDLNLYLKDWATNTEDQDHGRHRGLQRGERRQGAAFRPGPVPRRQRHQGRFDRARIQVGARHGPPAAKTRGMDAYMNQHKLDAVLFPGITGARSPPRRAIPASWCRQVSSRGFDGKDTPDYPLGVTFAGRAWSEHTSASGVCLRAGVQWPQATAGVAGALGLPDRRQRVR